FKRVSDQGHRSGLAQKQGSLPDDRLMRQNHSGHPVRAFFAFDPKRQAIVLCAGDKSNNKRFYDTMIRIADEEFTAHLTVIEEQK
ncbi:type II toxin-antitoxin system RelE/ParE family toxin, partial [Xenorhabdus bovienii]|uniref:type II toxin-antitoxin system RelE/ParE family toxin n=1 Tax=Xenorhabdus bovienii TaxID=40576 RepID=UPI0023B2F2E9